MEKINRMMLTVIKGSDIVLEEDEEEEERREQLKKKEDEVNKMIEKTAYVSTTDSGQHAVAEGFSIENLIKILDYDKDAMLEFSIKRGLPLPILENLVAHIKSDYSKQIYSTAVLLYF